MAQQLYALKQDLDMLARDIKELKRGYGLLDYLAQVAHTCELEQLAQGAQMRRIEQWFNKCGNAIDELNHHITSFERQTKARFDTFEKRAEGRMSALESRTSALDGKIDKVENTLALLVKNTGLIMKHLGIE